MFVWTPLQGKKSEKSGRQRTGRVNIERIVQFLCRLMKAEGGTVLTCSAPSPCLSVSSPLYSCVLTRCSCYLKENPSRGKMVSMVFLSSLSYLQQLEYLGLWFFQVAADNSSLKTLSWVISIPTVPLHLPVEFGTTHDFGMTV